VITALAPVIGYAEAARLAKEALATNAKVSELVVSRGLLGQAELDEILQPARLAGIEPTTDAVEQVDGDRGEA
jgi:aspartate ammonia-lyase